MAEWRTLTMVDGEAALCNAWLDECAAWNLFERLQDTLEWEQSVIRIHGRDVRIPRLNAWYGDAGAVYAYSGTRFVPKPWTSTLTEIRARIEDTTGHAFNGVLANLYRDGNDSVGWHSDDEPELDRNPVIASVSLGAERRFAMKHKHRKEVWPVYLQLAHGSLLLMTGATQHHWLHQLPKTKKPVGPRINLTFRLVSNRAEGAPA